MSIVGLFWLGAVCGDAQAAQASPRQPQSAPSKVSIGAYYYPWYEGPGPENRLGQWSQVMRLHLKPAQRPECGLYNSSDPNVVGAHIAQSLRGGVDFWAVSWWGPGSPTDAVFKNVILKHPDAGKLKFAVLYESTGRMGSVDNPTYANWIDDLQYIKNTYFANPNYLTINGRPVVFFYLSRVYFRNKGHEALERMRKQLPEIYLVGDDVFSPSAAHPYKAEWAAGFDAITVYDVYGQSIGPLGATGQAIEHLASTYRQARVAANSVGVGFMPTVAPGYNDTAVRQGHPGRARYFVDVDGAKEGDIFRAMLRRAALPNLDPSCNSIMMVTSFNEWYEDSQIEPSAGVAGQTSTDDSPSGRYYTSGSMYHDYGPLYLDILKEEMKNR